MDAFLAPGLALQALVTGVFRPRQVHTKDMLKINHVNKRYNMNYLSFLKKSLLALFNQFKALSVLSALTSSLSRASARRFDRLKREGLRYDRG